MADPGNGGPWQWRLGLGLGLGGPREWRTPGMGALAMADRNRNGALGMADPGNGGPWEWRTPGMADPGSGGPEPTRQHRSYIGNNNKGRRSIYPDRVPPE